MHMQSDIGCRLRTYARLAIPGRRHDQHCSKWSLVRVRSMSPLLEKGRRRLARSRRNLQLAGHPLLRLLPAVISPLSL